MAKALLAWPFNWVALVAFFLILPFIPPRDANAEGSPLQSNVSLGTVIGLHGTAFLLRQKLFERGFLSSGTGKFTVSATVVQIDSPNSGGTSFGGFAALNMRYRVTIGQQTVPIFEKSIRNSVRPNATVETAVTRNINQFIDALIDEAVKNPAFQTN